MLDIATSACTIWRAFSFRQREHLSRLKTHSQLAQMKGGIELIVHTEAAWITGRACGRVQETKLLHKTIWLANPFVPTINVALLCSHRMSLHVILPSFLTAEL